ncbi:hypothetical protein FKM82_006523 [Ascaphus truei]
MVPRPMGSRAETSVPTGSSGGGPTAPQQQRCPSIHLPLTAGAASRVQLPPNWRRELQTGATWEVSSPQVLRWDPFWRWGKTP